MMIASLASVIQLSLSLHFMESDKNDSNFDSKKDSNSDCKSNRNSKHKKTSQRNVIVSINILQSLITSATGCKACHELVHLVENTKKAVGLAFLLKIECLNQKCKQTDNNPTIPNYARVLYLIKLQTTLKRKDSGKVIYCKFC